MAEKKRLERFTSPVGIAVFPKLNVADTKFDAAGVYSVKLKFRADEPAVQKLIARIDACMEQAKAEANSKKKPGQKVKDCDPPYKLVYDDQEQETGEVEIKFSAKASGTTKDGRRWERKLALFDRFGKPTEEVVRGGASVMVSYSPAPWCNPKLDYGTKLYLEAAQVKANAGAARAASDFGFAADAQEESDEEVAPAASADDTDHSADF